MRLRDADFARPRESPRAGWALLAMGLAAAAGVAMLDQRWHADRESLIQARAQREEAQRIRSVPPPLPVPTLDERRQALVASELRRPWLPALRAVEAATSAPVYLTKMSVERASGLVRLEADAPTFAEALAYVERLARQPALSAVTLVSHQQTADAASGAPVVRISVSAGWGAR